MSLYNEQTEELFHVAGDAPDPIQDSGKMGYQSTTRVRPSSYPKVRYKDFVLECDLYQTPEGPIEVHLICPRCKNSLRVTQDRKRIEYSPTEKPEIGGRLSIERFQCTWEADTTGRRMEFGLGLCRWTVVIEDNIARDA